MKYFFVNLISKKSIVCFFFYAVGVGQLVAQSLPNVSQERLPTVKTPSSPVAASFNVYDEIPVSKYTGIPDISIPLYTIDLGSLQMPISLNYHPAGVRVEAEASWVGLGWSLNVGGTISREIKGLDDLDVNGHWYRYDQTGSDPNLTKPIPSYVPDCYYADGDCPFYFKWEKREDMEGCQSATGVYYNIYRRELKLDCEPDLFSYNFLGYSGRFVMKEGENRAILEKPEDGLQISITESWGGWSITVVLPTGHILYFNEHEEATSFSGASHIFDFPAVVGKRSITTWYLTAIETVDGNYISFEYAVKNNIERNVYITHTYSTNNFLLTPSFLTRLTKQLTSLEYPNPSCGSVSILPEASLENTKMAQGSFADREVYLKKIMWNGNRIDFLHSPRSDYGYPFDNKDRPVYLDALEIRNKKNKLIKGYSFNYSYFDIASSTASNYVKKRLRLDSLREYCNNSSLPSYRFTYNSNFELPLKTSLSFDVWGYYNGTSAYSSSENLFPEIVRVNNRCFFNWESPGLSGTVVTNGRDVRCNPKYITTGMLEKIIYPTGGCVELTFEPNTYISSYDQTEKVGGGVRIAKIKTDGVERLFSYNNGNKTSGILLVEPVFGYYYSIDNIQLAVYSSRSAVQLQGNTFGNIVGYQKVTETIFCDGKKSKTIDSYYSESELESNNLYTQDRRGMNGRLLSRYFYNNDTLVQKTEYDYESLPIELRPNQQALKFNDGVMYCYKVFPEQYKRLSNESIVNYLNNGTTQKVSTIYSYNNDNYMINRVSKTGNGKDIITKTIYTSDLDKDVYVELSANNVIKPVEVIQCVSMNDTDKVIGSQLTLYNNRAQPTKVYKLETDIPLTNFVPFTSTTGDNKDSRYSTVPELELLYNDGNVILPEESITRDGLHEFYIWGHSNSCILAKIENATKAQIKQYIPNYDRLYEGEPTDEFYQQINNLRAQLPQARVTTYIYDNLVGLKQCIEPDGTLVYYEYDNHNRLKCIRDNAGKVIEQYEYGYKQ